MNYDNHNEERIDEIIPRILEKLEKARTRHITKSDYIKELLIKKDKLIELSSIWQSLMLQIAEIQYESDNLLIEFQELLSQANIYAGEFSPDDIIKGGNNASKR